MGIPIEAKPQVPRPVKDRGRDGWAASGARQTALSQDVCLFVLRPGGNPPGPRRGTADDGERMPMHRRQENGNGPAHRVITCLNREQVDYLDKIGKDAQFSSGVKLSRTEVIAAMVNALRRLSLSGEGVATPEQFEQRIVDAIMTHRTRGGGRDGHP